MLFNPIGKEQIRKYAIKKLSVGVTSVCVGIGLAVCLPVVVFAEDMSEASPQPPIEAVVTDTSNDQELHLETSESLDVSEAVKASEVVVIDMVASNDPAVNQAPDQADQKAPVDLNKVTDGSFDHQYVSNKTQWQYREGGHSVLTTENGNSYAEVTSGTLDEHILQKVSTTVGKTYTLEADVKVEAATPHNGLYLTAKEANHNLQGPVIKEVSLTDTDGTWSHIKFSFTATTSETFVGLVKWLEASSPETLAASASIDNVSVVEENDYELIWQDEFSGDQLNQENWGYELGSIRGNEQQHYTDSTDNVYLENGNLVLNVTERKGEDRYANPRGGTSARQVIYDSGSVRTVGKQEFLYGRIEARAKLPKGKGAFPAFWTLGADFTLDGDIASSQGYGWPSTGELDIMELIGAPNGEHEGELAEGDQSNKTVYGTPHFYYVKGDADKDGSYSPTALGGNLTLSDDFYDDYHIFGINWYPDKIEWYVDGIVYNTMYLTGDERLEAAAAAFNKPQYLQFNLATGGNWSKNAGYYLVSDETAFVIDYVRYYQDAEQKAASEAYYASQPVLKGVKDLTMLEGTSPDLAQAVTTDQEGYVVDFSVENEYLFTNKGGNTNATLQASGRNDLAALSELAPGIYNIYYSAVPEAANLGSTVTPTAKIAREVAILTVLPKEGLYGQKGEPLSTVALPANWQWVTPEEILGSAEHYQIKYTTEGGRAIYTSIEASYISDQPISDQASILVDLGNAILDATAEKAAVTDDEALSKLDDVMNLTQGTVTIRYRLDTADTTVRSAAPLALLSISNQASANEYASFFIEPKNNKIGLEFKGAEVPIVKVGSGFNLLTNSDWQTISYVFTGSRLKIYLNGDLYGEADFAGFMKQLPWKASADTVTVGGLSRSYDGESAFHWGLKGLVDQVLIDTDVYDLTDIAKAHQPTLRPVTGEKTNVWDKYDEGVFEYRIPSVVKTPSGTLIAAADARKKHYNDWGDIATVVRISHDDGKTWSNNITVLDMPTQPYFTTQYSLADWNTNMTQSAFSIDSTLLTDASGKLYLLVDVFPESQGAVASKAGSGYELINGQYYLNLYDFDNHKYTVREGGIVYDQNGHQTDMYVDEGNFETAFSTRGNLYQTGAGEDILLGNIYLRSGRTKQGITREGSQTAPLFTYMTSFLWLLTSEDEGQTWSTPLDVTPQIKEDWMGFLGTGAAAGIEIDAVNAEGEQVKRLVFPIYYTNQQNATSASLGRQSSAIIFSDDGGQTWQRGESPNDGRIYGNNQHTTSKDFDTSVTELTENQIIQLNNGHLLQFMRNTGKTIVIARSTDYGATWEDNPTVTDLPEPYVNLSAIHMMVDGKEYVVLSNPLGEPSGEQLTIRNQRMKGILRVGEVLEDDSIDWVASTIFEPKRFAYSSLVQLDDERVGLLYEYSGQITYSTFNIKQMISDQFREDKAEIEKVTITSAAPKQNGAATLTIQVTFNQPMFILGDRQLAVTVDGVEKTASYVSGNGTDTAIFELSLDSMPKEPITVLPQFDHTIVETKYGIRLTDDKTYTLSYPDPATA
ncbi:TPA: family 16 glycosylhydrolase [Streptococcus equi subsp. zooepidemicus]|uniref:exo-alpha-sialidase n=4 Tax=Streptococcus equi TaxID=1336 RepID=UPI001E59C841|nr:exo-alpha-sialidase [Streptococcus equi]MCD3418331.1 family 16 glycosylhydrolase [Streptococcus equi subsp. zooepidemicus]HEK9988233.1 family 16 glycosylhydrolase [Streptococcus equi subsp. zooepidemicus]HEL0644556.1 family 16 glycosylhydrolase [Streptococcus equi subsp. zooepidemicus]HEL1076820.1 family 16 glycosylhydrolase [Streptococcus equi subsp. zooepidemicus]HEL1125187.1 family 16 glycosylhydrolase [Streptococcus equi subsp. zooepidemicus]